MEVSPEPQDPIPPMPISTPIEIAPNPPTSDFIKFIRIFLLVLIIIGIGLLITQNFWIPKLDSAILGSDVSSLSKQELSTDLKTNGTSVGWISISNEASSSAYYESQNLVYYNNLVRSTEISSADPATFFVSRTNTSFAKDSKNVYYSGIAIADADPATFVVPDVTNGYFKESNAEFYITNGSPCPENGCVSIIQGSDPATFSVGLAYAKDKNHVYLAKEDGRVDVLPEADPSTFTFIGFNIQTKNSGNDPGDDWYGFYGKDASHVYFEDNLMQEADPSFAFILDSHGNHTGYARDKTHIYNAWTATDIGADPNTFVVLNDYYAKDNEHVYSVNPEVVVDQGTTIGTILAGADSATFTLVTGQSTYDAQDKNHKYYEGTIVE